MKSSIARLAAPVAVAAALLVAGRESPLAECMTDIELSSAILGGSFVGGWADEDSDRSWVAILRVEREEWRPDSVFIANGLSGKDLERHYFRAQPLAVLSGSLRPDSLWLTNGVLRRPTKGKTLLVGECFEPGIGDTIVQVKTRSLAGTMPGTAFMGLCSTVPVKRGHALGIPLAAILERPGVAKQDTLPSVEDR